MAMQLAFDPQKADFSGLSTTRVFIGKVLQKTVMDVNEEGTSAAAATVVEGMSKGMMFDEPREITLVIDPPFIVAIRDQSSGHLLFLGTVVQPKAN